MILAIDPGNIESAYCLIDRETYKPIEFAKVKNEELIEYMQNISRKPELAIEMIASYGMAVGKEVFETCVWIGRFVQEYDGHWYDAEINYIYRKEVKLNLCGSTKAKDSNIRQALIDRFALFDFKNGKGTKNNKDFFYGFKSDIWAAYAVGVTYLDKGE
jgi:hypothetical protein